MAQKCHSLFNDDMRKRNVQLSFRATEEESGIIRKKMVISGCNSLSSYLKQMAIKGYMLEVDTKELSKMNYELSKIGNNINQLTKRANQTGKVYGEDIAQVGKEVQMLKFEVMNLMTAIINVIG